MSFLLVSVPLPGEMAVDIKKTKRKTAYMFVCGDGEQAFGPYGVTTLLTYMPPPPSSPLLREENSRQTRASALHAHARSHFQYAYI